MVNRLSWNFFDSFQSASGRREDFLTWSLATLLEGLPDLQAVFLDWLEPHVGVELGERRWEVVGNPGPVETPGFASASRVDMKFVSGDVELWFEHKWDASEGTRRRVDGGEAGRAQLDKYLAAARRYEKEHSRTVLLFYISGTNEGLEAGRFSEEELPSGSDEGGYVWIDNGLGHLRWRTFYPRMRDVHVSRRASVAAGDFRTRLLGEFLRWWETREGLPQVEVSAELFPEEKKDREGLWGRTVEWLGKTVYSNGKTPNTHGGEAIIFRPEREPTDVSHIRVWPVKPAEIPGWNAAEYGEHVLELSVRCRRESLEALPAMSQPEGRVVTRLQVPYEKDDEEVYLRYYVALSGWGDCLCKAARQAEVLEAVQVAYYLFVEQTGVVLSEPPSQ